MLKYSTFLSLHASCCTSTPFYVDAPNEWDWHCVVKYAWCFAFLGVEIYRRISCTFECQVIIYHGHFGECVKDFAMNEFTWTRYCLGSVKEILVAWSPSFCIMSILLFPKFELVGCLLLHYVRIQETSSRYSSKHLKLLWSRLERRFEPCGRVFEFLPLTLRNWKLNALGAGHGFRGWHAREVCFCFSVVIIRRNSRCHFSKKAVTTSSIQCGRIAMNVVGCFP